jgi:hypothetical protein
MSDAAALQRLISGYIASQAVYVAARLKLADVLAERGTAAAAEIAPVVEAEPAALHRLMRALAAFGVLEERADGRFALTAMGALLRSEVALSLRDQALFFVGPEFWATHGELEHCVRSGGTGVQRVHGTDDVFALYAADPVLGATFDAAMSAMAGHVARAVTAAAPLPVRGTVVDLGGGKGTLLRAILEAGPGLEGVLVELPPVAARAGPVLAGLPARIIGGDIFDSVPEAAELYLLSRVLHDFDDADSLRALRRLRPAMTAPGAQLWIIERVMPARMAADPRLVDHAIGDLRMMVSTGGRERTEAEFAALLEAAGLRLLRVVPTAGPISIVQAAPD